MTFIFPTTEIINNTFYWHVISPI